MILMATTASATVTATSSENAAECPYKKALAGQGLIHDSPFIMTGTQTVVDAKVQTSGTTDNGPSARGQ